MTTTTEPIMRFDGSEYRWLSNFWPIPIAIDIYGKLYRFRSVEHAFQAQKAVLESDIVRIQEAVTAAKAKELGRQVRKRDDWEAIRLPAMEKPLRKKFEWPSLARRLMDTYPRPLIEGNTWGDTYWGVCNGVGENNLGKLLMKIRAELILEQE